MNAHPVIQIAAVAVSDHDFSELESIELKIQFDPDTATSEALAVNSYDKDVWATDAVPEDQAECEFSKFLKRHATRQCVSRRGKSYTVANGVAHNGAGFDGPFLKAWYSRRNAFMPMWPVVHDTHQLAVWAFQWRKKRPANNKLGTLADFFGVKVVGDLHDALTDVRVMIEVTKRLRGLLNDGQED